jgi:PEP-CTERM motif
MHLKTFLIWRGAIIRVAFLAPLIMVLLASGAQAGTVLPVLDITSGSALGVFGGAGGSGGFSFNVASPTVVSGLGFFDVGANGLINSHQVGLWTGNGTLLATALISNSANVVPSASGIGEWLEVNIAPLTLGPGSYVLGAFYLDDYTSIEDQAVFFATATSSIPGVTFDSRCAIAGPGLMFPCGAVLSSPSSASIFGPMAFSSVPEPSSGTLTLLAAGLLLRLWRRRSAQTN